jgi:hypothetical protein
MKVSMNTKFNWIEATNSFVTTKIVLVLKTVILGILTFALFVQITKASEIDDKSKQLIYKVLEEMKQANPNTEITKEMLQQELQKRTDQEKVEMEKEQQELATLQHKLRAQEKNIMEKIIKSNDTSYIDELIMKKYDVSQKEAVQMMSL